MNDILQYLIETLQPPGYPGLVALLAALSAGVGTLGKLLGKLHKTRQQRKLLCDLHPFYTPQEIQRATQYYVETTCQNVAPSKTDEPDRSYAFATKEKIIPFFLKKAFTAKDENQFYLVLADSGMGKTTFLINLYLRYIEHFWGAKYQILLLPLGFPEIDQEIEKIPVQEQRRTILLLDAFDEDIQAVDDYKTRLKDLITKTVQFREVVITCRTQFFPSEEEEPKETGVMRFGGDGGERVFWKLYISPFDERDIQTYLRKRFRWYQRGKKRRARQIVLSCPNLMVRPMLLSYIEDLLQSQRQYTATYTVYAELISKWIERESHKVAADRREHYQEELWKFSREVAKHIYENRVAQKGSLLIDGPESEPFARRHGINLKDLELKSRSLLNRNACGQYKFSHKSILEYFLAEEAFFTPDFRRAFDFDGMSQAKIFFEEMVWEQLTAPFFERSDLNGEYSVKDGKTRVLTRLPEKLLAEITVLKLKEWNSEDDGLLFSGLKQLKYLGFEQISIPQRKELQHFLPQCNVFLSLHLRSQPLSISDDKAADTFKIHDVPGRSLEYIQNVYEDRGEVVFDHATGLLWQKSGSENSLTYDAALNYVKQLNRKKFAGYADWRLPTIPELMSLLEPEKQNEGLYISPLFDNNQSWCWSSDKCSSGSAWVGDFCSGSVDWYHFYGAHYVRTVRSRQ